MSWVLVLLQLLTYNVNKYNTYYEFSGLEFRLTSYTNSYLLLIIKVVISNIGAYLLLIVENVIYTKKKNMLDSKHKNYRIGDSHKIPLKDSCSYLIDS